MSLRNFWSNVRQVPEKRVLFAVVKETSSVWPHSRFREDEEKRNPLLLPTSRMFIIISLSIKGKKRATGNITKTF